MRAMILEFFSAFNTIQPALLREKLESAGVDCQMTAWTFDSPCCLPTGIQHNLEYRKVITDLVIWYELSHLHINTNKTKEMVVN